MLSNKHVEILDITTMPRPFRNLYGFLKENRYLRIFTKAACLTGLVCGAYTRRSKYDIVLVGSNPFLSLLVPSIIWTGKRSDLYYLAFDLFPETLGATNIPFPRWLAKILAGVRNHNFRAAKGVFTIGRDMKRYISACSKAEHIYYVPIWIGSTEPPLPPSTNKDTTGPVLHFFGNMGMVQDFSRLFQLLHQNKELRLEAYGAGAKTKIFQEDAPDKVIFHGPVPFTDRHAIFTPDIIGVVPQPESLIGLAVPSKAFYYWSRGLPILFLGSKASELGQIISSIPALGIVIPPEQSNLASSIEIDQISESHPASEIIAANVMLRKQAQTNFATAFDACP